MKAFKIEEVSFEAAFLQKVGYELKPFQKAQWKEEYLVPGSRTEKNNCNDFPKYLSSCQVNIN